MLVMVVFAIGGISPAAAQTVYVERYETYPAALAPDLAYVAPEPIVAPAPIGRQRTSPDHLRRNKSPGTNVGQEAGRPNGGPRGSKSMVEAPAQGRAIQLGASEPANSRASRMRRPNQFRLPFGTMACLGRGEPCSDAATDPFGCSKLNRTALQEKRSRSRLARFDGHKHQTGESLLSDIQAVRISAPVAYIVLYAALYAAFGVASPFWPRFSKQEP